MDLNLEEVLENLGLYDRSNKKIKICDNYVNCEIHNNIKIKINKDNKNIFLNHFIKKYNDIFELNDIIDFSSGKIMEKCYICYNYVKNPLNQFVLCDSSICLNKYCNMFIQNDIYDFYNKDKISLELIFKTLKYCLSSPHIETLLNPYPIYFMDNGLKSPQKISYLLLSIDENFHDFMNKFSCDEELYKFNKDIYYLFKFLIKTNNLNFYSTKVKSVKDIKESTIKSLDDDVIQFSVEYDPLKEKEFNKIPEKHYLFHGSNISNWYGIMRNGIKNYSGTALMKNGQAHGPGIYLSDNFDFSLGYSRRFTTSQPNELVIVGVFQLKRDITNYYKAPSIYVVQDDTELILRHMIIVNNTKFNKELTTYFRNTSLHKINQMKVTEILNKRLTNEIKILEKRKEYKINSYVEETNIILELNNDLMNYYLILRDYPNNPPIVIINKDNIYNLIILEKFCNKNWQINYKITDILEEIKDLETKKILKPIEKFDGIINKTNAIVDSYNFFIKKMQLY